MALPCSRLISNDVSSHLPSGMRLASFRLDAARNASSTRAGEGAFVPGKTPMTPKIMGKSKRDAPFIVLHDPALPWTTNVDWEPQGTSLRIVNCVVGTIHSPA